MANGLSSVNLCFRKSRMNASMPERREQWQLLLLGASLSPLSKALIPKGKQKGGFTSLKLISNSDSDVLSIQKVDLPVNVLWLCVPTEACFSRYHLWCISNDIYHLMENRHFKLVDP